MNAPCKDYPDRHEICHDSCERYIKFRRERERIRAAKEQERIRSKRYTAIVPYRIRGEQ